MDIDRRTHTPEDIRPVDAEQFYAEDVPRLLAVNGDVAGRALRATGLKPIAIAVGDVVATWRLGSTGDLEIVPGDDGSGLRADLRPELFANLVNEIETAMSVLMSGEDVMTRGRIGHLAWWDLALRALVDGRPAYEPGLIDFHDRNDDPLGLEQSFTLDDDPDAVRHFLAEAGYLHLRNVFTPAEMAELNDEMSSWLDTLGPDDPRSWFARVGDEQVCVRATDLARDDIRFPYAERLAPLAELVGCGHRYRGTDFLRKPVGVSEGISDLPWHRDCDPGLHRYKCSSLTVGVSVTPSGDDNGQLGVIAGSHRASMTLFDLDRVDLPRRYLNTEVGDVTVHLSCTLHCATPPVHAERRVSYSSLVLPVDTAELDAVFRANRDAAGRKTYAPA